MSSTFPITREDMERMIRFRWTVASGDPGAAPPFSAEAYDALYQLSKGNPRLACKLCHAALLLGFMDKTYTITPQLVTRASTEL